MILQKVSKLAHNIALELSWLFTRLSPCSLRVKEGSSGFLILSAGSLRITDPHSFGDEMMFVSICRHIETSYPGADIAVLCFEGCPVNDYDFYGHRIHEVGFSSKDYLSFSSYEEFMKIACGFSDVYLIGADCLDGAYWRRQTIQMLRFMSLAVRLGCRGRILGFSYNGTKDGVIRRELQRASNGNTLCVRDGISLNRLSAFISRNMQLVSDLAFVVDTSLFSVPGSDIHFHERLKGWRSGGCLIIAINICGWHWDKPDVYLNRFSDYLLALSKMNSCIRYLLLPHDNRQGRISDSHTLSLLHDKLSSIHEKVLFCESISGGIRAKQLVCYADVLLTGRMHLAIAALSQAIPTISLMYQGKFEGLYDHYRFDKDYYFPADDLENIFGSLDEVLMNRKSLSSHIASLNKSIFHLSAKNFN